ncbi:prepilin-type N-terminal cleavage/methylation domain-containing protein [Candidatus Sumerlaeota bacterium]|nr:prepilin-type N-terminal cleavage/methylation domain-containing protein [Candidatus Sumerlaeota bacterium]
MLDRSSRKNGIFGPDSVAPGFTLIELLIVVLIIAILAAIAVPNFLEFQTRAKVSRCMADMRSLATAIEAYAADDGYYPLYGHIRGSGEVQYPATDNISGTTDQMSFVGYCLTTPIGYISVFPMDPFANNFTVTGAMADDEGQFHITKLEYINLDQHVNNFHTMGVWPAFAPYLIPAWGNWRMVGAGPDGDRGADIKSNIVYDPTNGTVSDGDVVRCQRYSESRYNPDAP